MISAIEMPEIGDRGAMQAALDTGTRYHQRHAGRTFKEAHLEPQAALAQHVAMVGTEHDDGIVEHAGAGQRIDQFADFLVDIGDVGEIAAPGTGHVLL
jgi:hypothetical protein